MPEGPIHLTSLAFAGFVAVVLALYYLVPRRGQPVVLLVASYLFYALWSRWFPPVLAAVTLWNYAWPFGFRKTSAARPYLLAAAIAGNLAVLVGLKYAATAAPGLWESLSLPAGPLLDLAQRVVLPVGLSYYVLQGIGYLVDTYQGQMPPRRDLVGFSLYLAYFPKLLAGPIERPSEFLDQLGRDRRVDGQQVARSLSRIVLGLVRKLVIANALLAASPDAVFLNPADQPPVVLGTALVAFAFGLYNDFAGYTDIAIGVSGLFGISLSANFRQPMFSVSVTDLWGRWHISLSRWLRDYLYLPLARAGLRRGWGRRLLALAYVPALATMVVSGLWHGISVGLIAWGVGLGLLVGTERYLHERFRFPGRRAQSRWWRILAPAFVMAVVTLLLVPFRSPLEATVEYWRGLLGWRPWMWTGSLVPVLATASLFIDGLQARGGEAGIASAWPRLARATALALALLGIFLATRGSSDPLFIYQGF